MKFTIFIFTILLASLDAYSENADSVYAAYCIDFEDRSAMLLLVKKNKDLTIDLNLQEPLKCEDPE